MDSSRPDASAVLALTEQAPSRRIPLGSGRSIEVREEPGADVVKLCAVGGQCVLAVRWTDEGPVLSFSGASIEVNATRTLALACEALEVRATRSASIEVGGDLIERVHGDAARTVDGRATIAARSAQIAAAPGGLVLQANDDVTIRGERVRLNSDDPPMPLTWEEHEARSAAAEASRLAGDERQAGGGLGPACTPRS